MIPDAVEAAGTGSTNYMCLGICLLLQKQPLPRA